MEDKTNKELVCDPPMFPALDVDGLDLVYYSSYKQTNTQTYNTAATLHNESRSEHIDVQHYEFKCGGNETIELCVFTDAPSCSYVAMVFISRRPHCLS